MTRPVLAMRVSDEERARLQAAADRAGLPLATWCREALLLLVSTMEREASGVSLAVLDVAGEQDRTNARARLAEIYRKGAEIDRQPRDLERERRAMANITPEVMEQAFVEGINRFVKRRGHRHPLVVHALKGEL